MLKILLLPIIGILFIILFLGGLLSSIIRSILLRKTYQYRNQSKRNSNTRDQKESDIHQDHSIQSTKKVFSKEEGEYVDFEEVE